MGVQELRKRYTVKDDVSLYVATTSNLVWLEKSFLHRVTSLPKLIWAVFIPLLFESDLKLVTYEKQLPVKKKNVKTLSIDNSFVFLEAYSYTNEISVSPVNHDQDSTWETAVIWFITIIDKFISFTVSVLLNQRAVLIRESNDVEIGYFDYRVSYNKEKDKEMVELTTSSSSEFKVETDDKIVIR